MFGFPLQYLMIQFILWGVLFIIFLFFLYSRVWRIQNKMGKWFVRLGLICYSTIFAFLLCETIFAISYDATDSFNLALVSQRWYDRHVQLNNWQQFRDKKSFTATTRQGVCRLALFGDSFAFGHGIKKVAHRFGDRLETELQKRCPTPAYSTVEVYNLAIPGADTQAQLDLQAALSQRTFTTNAVLLAYCLNDMETLDEDSKYLIGTILIPKPGNLFSQHFYLPNYWYFRYSQFTRPEVRGYFNWLSAAYTGPGWEIQKQRLSQFHQWCQRQSAPLYVILFPFMHNLGPSYPFRQAHAELVSFWQDRQVPVLDLLPVFEQQADRQWTLHRFDAHPNEAAHQLAADAILQQWGDLLLTPAEESFDHDADLSAPSLNERKE